MISPEEMAARAGRLAIAAIVGSVVWWSGIALAKLRGVRPENVVWFEEGTLGIGIFGIPFGVAAVVARLTRVHGWDSDVVWVLSAICFAMTAVMALIVFRYRLIFTSEGLMETRVFRSGSRRIEWTSVKSWRSGRKPGSVILQLRPRGKFEITSAFKTGIDALYEEIDARNIPSA